MLGHADIATTARYANSDTSQVRAAMERAAAQHNLTLLPVSAEKPG
jgi:site-specific recombinase XerD